jgi:Protein of unknown function (DUF3071)
MQDLRLVAANERGSHLVLRSATGEKYLLSIDDRLKAAVRGDRSRLGQLDTDGEAALRPRDIQARIRAGASAEQVARAAGVPVDRVRRFEGPVLAEREHIAMLAQKSTVRRPGLDMRPVTLGETLDERLSSVGVKPEGLAWDSWRRDDGRWVVQVAYSHSEQTHVARYLYDPRARSVIADNDEARWLTGEIEQPPVAGPFVPRLAPTAEEETEAAQDAAVQQQPPAAPRRPEMTLTRRAPDVSARRAAAVGAVPARRPAVQFGEQMEVPMPMSAPAAAASGPGTEPAAPAAPVPSSPVPPAPAEPIATEQPAARTGTDGAAAPRSSRRRASVPAWDDIVFGARRPD